MRYDNIIYEVDEGLGLITINRPAKLNAISLATLDELQHAVARAGDDEAVCVIGITGAGPQGFCRRV